MRSVLLSIALLAFAPSASAQAPLTTADRAPLHAESGFLVHPTLGFRLRDVGLTERRAEPSAGGTPRDQAWAYSRDYEVVRIVLTASESPDAFARQSVAESANALVGLGATLVDRSDTAYVTSVTLRRQGHVMAFRGASFRDGERGFALVVTVVHSDGAYARAVADSLHVPVEERAAGLASAGLPRLEIQAAINASLQGVGVCYWARVSARPELRGHVVARFSIRADGAVQDVTVSESTLDDDVVEACVMNAIAAFRFAPRTPGSALVSIEHPFVFEREEPRPTPVAPATTTTTTTTDEDIRGSLARELIRTVIRDSIPYVRACYESALGAQPDLRGRVTVSFIINADGSVHPAEVSSTTINHPGVEQCLVRVVQTLQFPAPLGGGVVGVNYPFLFDSGP